LLQFSLTCNILFIVTCFMRFMWSHFTNLTYENTLSTSAELRGNTAAVLIKRMLSGADPEFQVRGAHERRGARICFGYFVWKITILRQQILFFPILGGGGRGGREPRWIRPCIKTPCVFSHLYLSVCVFKECSYMWDNL
jgi:hypothetical protein